MTRHLIRQTGDQASNLYSMPLDEAWQSFYVVHASPSYLSMVDSTIILVLDAPSDEQKTINVGKHFIMRCDSLGT